MTSADSPTPGPAPEQPHHTPAGSQHTADRTHHNYASNAYASTDTPYYPHHLNNWARHTASPPRPHASTGLIVALVLSLLSLVIVTILSTLTVILILGSESLDSTTARTQQPWSGGGGIIADGSLCSTAGLGTYQGRWAFLTAAHCVNYETGTTVHTVSGKPLGTAVWIGEGVDLAIIDILDQDSVHPTHAIAWTGHWTQSAYAPITASARNQPRNGTDNIWFSGIQLGAVGGKNVGIVNDEITMDDGETLSYVRVLRGAPDITLAVEGMSGGGAYLKTSTGWTLWGVLTRGSEPLHLCATYLGEDPGCTHDAYVAPIGPALDAGFRVATHPHTQN